MKPFSSPLPAPPAAPPAGNVLGAERRAGQHPVYAGACLPCASVMSDQKSRLFLPLVAQRTTGAHNAHHEVPHSLSAAALPVAAGTVRLVTH
ncbi:Hypothetical protein GSB_152187 [Giardia duodenalis]|uniref:Uncharacterized protein n=1 Tax=Giardia intestinalis TaxID=5741 RepID=V6TSR8_GIAIN|nr:Hypothetical protein GSB_152187 [Giardia intestinalis]